jgi:nucleotide-binding universal stress UspA family protein
MKEILLATDGSNFARSSAAYLADLFKGAVDVRVTVLHVLPSVPPLYQEELYDPLIRRDYALWKEKRVNEAKRYTEEAVNILHRGGFKKNHVQARIARQIVGVARDIIREADAGYYDACVLGKKGMGWLDDIFLGSITNKLLEISENHPVWLVSGNEWKSRKVLVAMDHTPKAVHLARYVGEMLRGLEGVQIHFYHHRGPFAENLTEKEKGRMREIERRMTERDREEMDRYFGEARKVLEELGYDRKALSTRFDFDESASSQKVSQAILQEVRKGKYGTLVLGRKGSTQAREFRLGSVVLRTVSEVENCTVWVV